MCKSVWFAGRFKIFTIAILSAAAICYCQRAALLLGGGIHKEA